MADAVLGELLRCPSCAGADLVFELDAVVCVRVVAGVLVSARQGWVLGGSPERFCCSRCAAEFPIDSVGAYEGAGVAFRLLVEPQLPEPARSQLAECFEFFDFGSALL